MCTTRKPVGPMVVEGFLGTLHTIESLARGHRVLEVTETKTCGFTLRLGGAGPHACAPLLPHPSFPLPSLMPPSSLPLARFLLPFLFFLPSFFPPPSFHSPCFLSRPFPPFPPSGLIVHLSCFLWLSSSACLASGGWGWREVEESRREAAKHCMRIHCALLIDVFWPLWLLCFALIQLRRQRHWFRFALAFVALVAGSAALCFDLGDIRYASPSSKCAALVALRL